MEALFAKHLMPSIFDINEFRGFLVNPKRVNSQRSHSRIISLTKRSTFQDFQGFAKPLRLLPATEANTYSNYVPEERFSSTKLDKSSSFYILELRTSNYFSSCLSNLDAGILLCVIDLNGDSVLQRISAAPKKHSGQCKEVAFSETNHFLRGSIDIVTFMGPKLGKIDALWIGLESVSADGTIGNLMEALLGFKGPLLSLALATTAAVARYGMGESSMVLTPAGLFVGVLGFLTCKVAVVLAAFKPIKRSL